MINENEKVYYICQQCSKNESCIHYDKVIQTIKEFVDTPLNIHFPMCKEYDSALYKTLHDIENGLPIINTEEITKDDISKIFINWIKERNT